MLIRLFSEIGTFSTLIGLVFTLRSPEKPFMWWQYGLIIFAFVLFIICLYVEIKEYEKNKVIELDDDTQIRNFMYNWIRDGRRVVVLTRDMSWVNDDEMKDMLLIKAHKKELEICMPDYIPFAKELQEAGAEIYTFKELNYIPKSRFTIVNKGKVDTKVAIGSTNKKVHTIQQYTASDNSSFYMANDLIEIISNCNKLLRSMKQDEVASSKQQNQL